MERIASLPMLLIHGVLELLACGGLLMGSHNSQRILRHMPVGVEP